MPAILDILGSGWVPLSLLLLVSFYFRWTSDSWIAPPGFVGMYWTANLACSLLAVDHGVPSLGVWALVSLVFAVQVGAFVAYATVAKIPIVDLLYSFRRLAERVRNGCIVLTLIAVAGEIYFIIFSLGLFGKTFDFASLIQMAAQWTFLRYDGFIDPWPLRLAAVWIYPPALLGGILLPLSETKRDKIIAATTLFPSLLLTFLSGGRAAFLVAFACWLGGYWAAQVISSKPPRKLLRIQDLSRIAAACTGLLLLYVSINTFRGAKDASGVDELHLDFNSGQIRNYMFGSPAAFADWFNRGNDDPLSWGALTFPGLFDALHIQQKTLGTYIDSSSTVGQEGTNIFTIFRGLIQDFGLMGALLISMAAGFWGSAAYRKQQISAGRLLGLAAFYTVAIFSPLYCIFGFNGPILAWLTAAIVLRPAMTSGYRPRMHAGDCVV